MDRKARKLDHVPKVPGDFLFTLSNEKVSVGCMMNIFSYLDKDRKYLDGVGIVNKTWLKLTSSLFEDLKHVNSEKYQVIPLRILQAVKFIGLEVDGKWKKKSLSEFETSLTNLESVKVLKPTTKKIMQKLLWAPVLMSKVKAIYYPQLTRNSFNGDIEFFRGNMKNLKQVNGVSHQFFDDMTFLQQLNKVQFKKVFLKDNTKQRTRRVIFYQDAKEPNPDFIENLSKFGRNLHSLRFEFDALGEGKKCLEFSLQSSASFNKILYDNIRVLQVPLLVDAIFKVDNMDILGSGIFKTKSLPTKISLPRLTKLIFDVQFMVPEGRGSWGRAFGQRTGEVVLSDLLEKREMNFDVTPILRNCNYRLEILCFSFRHLKHCNAQWLNKLQSYHEKVPHLKKLIKSSCKTNTEGFKLARNVVIQYVKCPQLNKKGSMVDGSEMGKRFTRTMDMLATCFIEGHNREDYQETEEDDKKYVGTYVAMHDRLKNRLVNRWKFWERYK